jgi:N-acetylglutamate synthase-like GNAT family acetyltransferase
MKLRPIKQNEIKSAVKILVENYSRKFEKAGTDEIREMFRNGTMKPEYIVAEDKGEIIGVAGYIQSWMDYNIYNIFWVNVLPLHQGKGIGTALIKKTIELISKKKSATTILLTTDKPGFYSKRFGFKTVTEYEGTHGKYKLMSLNL